MLDQIEIDPFNQKKTDVAYLRSQGIVPEAWGPLGQERADLYTNPVLKGFADQHQKTVAQVVLRWNIQRGSGGDPQDNPPGTDGRKSGRL